MNNTIRLAGEFVHEEAVAAGTIKPGYLIEETSAGKFQAHSAEGGYAEAMFAVEDALQGNSIDDSYAADDLVSANIMLPGGRVFAYLAAGYAYTVGMELVSAGDGTLMPLASVSSGTTVEQLVARIKTALDLSGSGAVATRTEVRVA